MKTGVLLLACHPREGGDPTLGLAKALDSRLRGNDKSGRLNTVAGYFLPKSDRL